MPRKSRITRSGREYLRGGAKDVRRLDLKFQKGAAVPIEIEIVVVDGNPLNKPESFIYHALTLMDINFSAQVLIGTGRSLGGGNVDFLLPDYDIALEYQGYFHFSFEGEARDFLRQVTREMRGLEVVYLFERDLTDRLGNWERSRLMGRIREIIGWPLGQAALRS